MPAENIFVKSVAADPSSAWGIVDQSDQYLESKFKNLQSSSFIGPFYRQSDKYVLCLCPFLNMNLQINV
jgi:hypothetical protein